MVWLLVAIGGAIGAPTRYLVGRWAKPWAGSTAFPAGTFVVNMTGCFLLGMFTGADLSAEWFGLVGTGFCGAYTTYSTFSHEAVSLNEKGDQGTALIYVAVSVVVGLLLALAGYEWVHD